MLQAVFSCRTQGSAAAAALPMSRDAVRDALRWWRGSARTADTQRRTVRFEQRALHVGQHQNHSDDCTSMSYCDVIIIKWATEQSKTRAHVHTHVNPSWDFYVFFMLCALRYLRERLMVHTY